MIKEKCKCLIEIYPTAQTKVIIKDIQGNLTTNEIVGLVNSLISFENSHIIATNFKDDKIAYSLYQELKSKFEKEY